MNEGSITGTMLWVFGLLAMIALLIVVVAWPLAKVTRAKVALGREDRYRDLAEAAVGVQQATEQRLAALGAELDAMRSHLAAMQKVLTEVD